MQYFTEVRGGKQNYFLGAGASKADGAPLQAELFKAYVNSLSCSFNLDYHNRYHKTKRNVFAYFADFFGIDIEAAITNNQVNNISFPTFEEALGILDLAISKMNDTKPVAVNYKTFELH